MKRFIFCYLILFPFAGNSQQLLFNKTYSNSTGARAVIEREDGKFFIVGGKLLLTDSAGNLLWEKSSEMYRSNSLIETKDHHYLISGQSNNVPSILKVDSVGNKIWLKEFPGYPAKDFAYSIIETYDSNYIFLSTGYFDIDTSSILFKINANGDFLWSKSFSNSFCYSVVQTIDSGSIMAGVARNANWEYPLVIIKSNKYGDLIYTDTLNLNIHYWGNTIIPILGLPDGGWIITFASYRIDDPTTYGNLVRYDSIGGTRWSNWFYGKPQCIKPCKNGGFIVSSMTYNSNNNYLLYIIKFDGTGSIQWQRQFNESISSPGNNITETRDGGFVLTGYTQYGSFLIKLDSAGNYMVSVNDIKKSASLLSVYPNPTEDEITFSLNSDNGNLINEITIYNVCGQEVKHSIKLAESDFKLSVNRLDPGIYFYSLTTDDLQVIHGKFMLK